ncbi:lipopolysaccharide biosynthesis protein [Nocardioides dongkuii]|uniref:lipopolysaccharide biosynthesis protein n=1 Tax=Nocardioides dongkuii TaxID=2760089 RepID=UPI0015F8AA80|nr:hypothetical protein [Nocardioides dongkuii]
MLKRVSALTVAAGSFSIPVAQWVVFWLVARAGGTAEAGAFALCLAAGTTIFTITNFGLRDSYITLHQRYRLRSYFLLRIAGGVLGSAAFLGFAATYSIDFSLVAVILWQKVADSFGELFCASLQRRRRLGSFGAVMLCNGIASLVLAFAASAATSSTTVIVGASAIGSSLSLAVAAFLVCRRVETCPGGALPSVSDLVTITRLSSPIAAWQGTAILVLNLPTWCVAALGEPEDIGRFAALAYLLIAGSLIGTTINSIYIGEYQGLLESRGSAHVIRTALRSALFAAACGLAFSTAFATFGSSMIQTIYGEGFKFSHADLALVGVAAALNPASQVIAAGLLVLNRYGRQFRVVAVSGVLMLIVASAMGSSEAPVILTGCLVALVGSGTKFALSVRYLRLPTASVPTGGPLSPSGHRPT